MKNKSIETLEEAFSSALAGDFDLSAPVPSGIKGKEKTNEAKHSEKDDLRDVTFEILDNAMRVVLRAKDSKPVTVEQLLTALHDLRISYGIDMAALQTAAETSGRGGGWSGNVLVASGEQPTSPYKLSFPFLEQHNQAGPSGVWLVDGVPFSLGLDRFLQAQDRSKLQNVQNLSVKAVRPKSVIVRVAALVEGKPGKNVFGEIIRKDEFPLQMGANISFEADTKSYISDIYGYVFAEGDKLEVLPPLWITPDKMDAYYVCLPQVGDAVCPKTDELVFLLLKYGLADKCIHYEVVNKLCRMIASGEPVPVTVKIASGILPVNGCDAEIFLSNDYRKRAGTLRSDKSLDLRERNAVVAVTKGALLAEKKLPTKGVDGLDLFGQVLPAVDGRDISFKAGKGVLPEENEDHISYYAKNNGNVVLNHNTLSIAEVFNITGDVDYETGNVVVNSDLYINGSIRPGFTVKCGGNLHIQGSVENGAFVSAKGNVSIGNGVIGETTKVVCYGNLFVQFIQDAEVLAKGDITVNSYIFSGMTRAGGSITVKTTVGTKGGRVIGGVVCASKGIQCKVVGSVANRNTVVSLQASPEKLELFQKLGSTIKSHQEKVIKMMRTLQLPSFDPLVIKGELEKLKGKNKELFAQRLLNLHGIIKEKNSLELEKQRQQEKVAADLEKAAIRVSGKIFQGNVVQISEKKLVVSSDLGPSTFQIRDGKITA